MNVGNPGQRFRGPPNGAQMGSAGRPTQEHRNGPSATTMTTPAASNGSFPAGAQMSRAEKFEDEKKRIIESCFGKKEPDGSLSESYITHIRIEEDAAYPSSPPPTQSPPDNKKQRVIVVAVRKSGRVRMHKARENANGSFSIGKTWVLDDLTIIESFTNAIPKSAEDHQNKQRAGSTGFVVTVQKPYYWNAATAKEKEFFIFSLIKIFKKYTGGRLPELLGFNPQELEQLGGVPGPQAGMQQQKPQSNASMGPPPRAPSQETTNTRDPRTNAPPSDTSRERRPRPSQERPTQERPLHSAQSQERPLRAANSNDRIRMPGSFPPSESITPQTSQPQLRTKRSMSPGSQAKPAQPPSFRRPAGGQQSEPSRNGSDLQPPQRAPSRQQSNERTRQNGLHPMGLRPGANDQQRSEPSDERPSTAVKDLSLPSSLSVPDPRSQRPATATKSSFQSEYSSHSQDISAQAPDTVNGDLRDRSASRSARERELQETPSINQSETSGERLSEDTRPTTASSQGVQPEQMPTQSNAASSITTSKNEEDLTTSKPIADIVSPTPPPETPAEPEGHRPGLGPMIKKKSNKEIASTFRRAANAYNAFKPRAGGAVEKFKDDNTASGDGITGVFQAPSLLRGASQNDSRPATPAQAENARPSTPQLQKDIPALKVTKSPPSIVTSIPQEPSVQSATEPEKTSIIREKSQEDRRKRRRSDHSSQYAKTLGINPSILEGRTYEIESVLNDFSWGECTDERTTFEELEIGIRKELARVEAGSWLGAVENNDDRALAVGEMMDRVMAEAEELDCLLTLYNVELGTLSEDVAYIEAQSQGLQVQTANQKLLHTELKNLLNTISISASELRVLKDTSLTNNQGIQVVERTLSQLYTAMLTIDPKLRHTGARPVTAEQDILHRSSSTGNGGGELSSMNAVREKREGYRRESIELIQRLKQYMSVLYRQVEAETLDALERNRSNKTSSNSTKLDHLLREKPKKTLWIYSPLMLFAREIEPLEWEDLMRMYEGSAKKPYQDEFRENVFAWKRITRKPAGDEQDVLFTTQEKESESLVGRKLTVKRSKTVRNDGSSRISSGDKPKDGKVTAYEAFAGALGEMARIIFVEQNFVVDLFHISSLNTQDFVDAVATEPEQRRGGDLIVKKPFDPDRSMSRKVLSVMEEIFSFWTNDLQSLVDWIIKQDALNGVGVLFALESQLSEIEDTNQEFLSQAVSNIHDRLATHFTRFVEEQIRGIEDTKVKIKKRKGVIAFMKTFPNFTAAVEKMLPPTRSLDHLPVRGMANDAYQQINKAMFESLKFIAKESPTAVNTLTATGGDPEDKEALNHHILLIENMNHYIEEVAISNNPVLEDWNFRARAEMNENMELYMSSVIRRPLGKLLDFLESTESLILSNPASAPAIATRASHSRSVFKKILSSHDAKEIRRGIETLKKRVEKHFGEGDDNAQLSRELVTKMLKECESRYLDVGNRAERLVRDVYEGSLEVEWRREDVITAFRR